ncbi:MAG TPA: energy transducer TonB [Candidatus Dormibacteraeota bacterium]|jgi:TonB family protein|nr:energy transducer TonB [Candidatus Dormibacteraeota bacterium]
MNRFSIFVFLACLIPPYARTQSVQQRAEALLDKARQLSDIRSPNAPAFRLKATFSTIGKNLDTIQGTYTEVWVSESRWRRETVVKDQHRIEVGGPARLWLLDNTADFPELAAQVPSALSIFPSRGMSQIYDSISAAREMKPPAECAITKPNSHKLKSAFCFDKTTGFLLAKILPEVRPNNAVEHSCDYGSFHKVGDHWLPYKIACSEDQHLQLDAAVVEISPEPSPDPALFTPPPGAIELGLCQQKSKPPRPAVAPSPRWPPGSDLKSEVTVSLIVDAKGIPQDVKVVDSAGASFDEAAVNTVRSWKFFPATCAGDPMPMQTKVKVQFPRQLH